MRSMQILNETTMRMSEAAEKVHLSAARMYAFTRGIVIEGKTIILESVQIGGTVLTSAEALARFGDACQAAKGNPLEREPGTVRRGRPRKAKTELLAVAS